MGDLYGFIGPVGNPEVLLIQTDRDLQNQLTEYFNIYQDQFRDGVEEVVAFDGGYSPDPHQHQQLPLTVEMNALAQQIARGAIGRDVYDPRQRAPEELRALAWSDHQNGAGRILIQNFTRAQALSRRTAIFFTGETFTRLQEPSLVIGNKIDAIIEGGLIQFQNFGIIKQIFDLQAIYREATDADIRQFAEIENVAIADIDNFCSKANKTARKLIFSVQRSNILGQKTAAEIQTLAAGIGLDILVDGDRVVLAPGRDLVKQLKFLDNSIYRSPLDNERWMANSRRRF